MAPEKKSDKTTNGASGAALPLVFIPLSQIHADADWNARHKTWKDAAEEPAEPEAKGQEVGESTGFAGFRESIENDGQDTPVTVRPHPDPKQRTKTPYSLVCGFRRVEAIAQLAAAGKSPKGTEKGMVLAIVRDMTEAQAEALNLRENLDRESISGADVVWGVQRLCAAGMNQAGVASELGKTQGYISKLNKIATKVDAALVNAWRQSPVLTIEEMGRLADVKPEEQKKAYKAIVERKSGAGKGTGGRGRWDKTAMRQAAHLGTMLGRLEREGILSSTAKVWKSEKVVPLVCTVPENAKLTDAKATAILEAGAEAYEAALSEGEEPDAEETEAPKKSKGTKKGGEATASAN